MNSRKLRKILHLVEEFLAIILLGCIVAVPGLFLFKGLTRDVQMPGNEGRAVLGAVRRATGFGTATAASQYLEADPAVRTDLPEWTEDAVSVNYIHERVRDDERQVVCLGTLSASQEDLDALNAVLKSYRGSISVKAVSTDGTRGLSFNSAKGYDASSTIKGPYAYYCYLQMEEGNGSLEETMTYTGAYYAEGTGSIRYRATGTTYTFRELLYRTMWESDNIGYAMCVARWGHDGYNAFMESLGCDSLMLTHSIWPSKVRVEDLVIVWSEIYHYFERGTELSEALYESCTPGAWNCLAGAVPDDCEISQKYGWASTYGDGAIVRTPQGDYILSVFVNSPGTGYDQATVTRVAAMVHEIMTKERLVDRGR